MGWVEWVSRFCDLDLKGGGGLCVIGIKILCLFPLPNINEKGKTQCIFIPPPPPPQEDFDSLESTHARVSLSLSHVGKT